MWEGKLRTCIKIEINFLLIKIVAIINNYSQSFTDMIWDSDSYIVG